MSIPADIVQLRAVLNPLPVGPPDVAAARTFAGVLVLLYPGESGVSFALTVRPDSLSRHAGQISLPGGRVEQVDTTVVQTALRETREELGCTLDDVAPLGTLDVVDVRVSGFCVVPVVAWSEARPDFVPDTREVQELLEVPLTALLDPDVTVQEVWDMRGHQWRVTLFRLGGHAVWGATARILGDLGVRLGASHYPHSPPGSVTRLL